MKLSRKHFGGWPYPVCMMYPQTIKQSPNGVYYLPSVFRRPSRDLHPIVSASQAFVIQRALVKKFQKYINFHKKESLRHYSLNCLLAIEPGAFYFYEPYVIGSRRVSKPCLPENFKAPNIIGEPEFERPLVHYTEKVYANVLHIVSKHIVKEALECTNG